MAQAEGGAPGASPAVSPTVAFGASNGSIYAPAIATQLSWERDRRTALQGSASEVLRSAGTLLTLFTALLAVFKGSRDVHFTSLSLGLIVAAYALLILASLAAISVGLVANRIVSYGEVPSSVLESWLDSWDSADPAGAAAALAKLEIENLKVLRHDNVKRRRLATLALSAELLGALTLVLTLASVVL